MAEAVADYEQTQHEHGLLSQKRPITSTLDHYLLKKSPAKYLANSDPQRRLDLDIMAYIATTNLPFAHVEPKGFKRCVCIVVFVIIS